MGLGSILGKCNQCQGTGSVTIAQALEKPNVSHEVSYIDAVYGFTATQEHKVELIEPLSHAPKALATKAARKIFKRASK